jgi:bifunctional DNase/RNase
MKSVCDTFHLELDHIFICDFVEGIFFSKLVFTQNDETVEIDSRTSDALAMAVRFDCPIFVSEKIMSEAGVDTNEEDELAEEEELIDEQIEELTSSVPPSSPKGSLNFSSYSKEQLEQELTQAIENEDYELAARIRDELNKR